VSKEEEHRDSTFNRSVGVTVAKGCVRRKGGKINPVVLRDLDLQAGCREPID